jgi:hypothetical protein
MKPCPRCKQIKPLADYHKCAANKDGKQTYCKPCEADMQREYMARHAAVIALRRVEKLETAATTGVKTCTKCRVTQPMLSFYQHRGTRDGRATYCKDCQKAASRAWTAAHRERVKAENARRYAADTDRQRRNRSYRLKMYGLTEDQYDALAVAQGHVCAICLEPEKAVDPRTKMARRLAVDHDHDTLKVRGLLCHACNTSIGRLGDNHERLERAVAYLKKAAAMH